MHEKDIDTRWKNRPRYIDNVKSLGRLMLLARRLCEHGAGFVTVTTNFVWDMHADVNNASMVEGMGYMGVPFDHAIAAFLDDVEQRGLSDKILLVCVGEMGRGPKINKNGGRDHWGGLAPLLLYGSGIPRGAVVGQSNRIGGEPQSQPFEISNLVSTVLQTVIDAPALRLETGFPPEVLTTMSAPTLADYL